MTPLPAGRKLGGSGLRKGAAAVDAWRHGAALNPGGPALGLQPPSYPGRQTERLRAGPADQAVADAPPRPQLATRWPGGLPRGGLSAPTAATVGTSRQRSALSGPCRVGPEPALIVATLPGQGSRWPRGRGRGTATAPGRRGAGGRRGSWASEAPTPECPRKVSTRGQPGGPPNLAPLAPAPWSLPATPPPPAPACNAAASGLPPQAQAPAPSTSNHPSGLSLGS